MDLSLLKALSLREHTFNHYIGTRTWEPFTHHIYVSTSTDHELLFIVCSMSIGTYNLLYWYAYFVPSRMHT
jgi:hypothetical protein